MPCGSAAVITDEIRLPSVTTILRDRKDERSKIPSAMFVQLSTLSRGNAELSMLKLKQRKACVCLLQISLNGFIQ